MHDTDKRRPSRLLPSSLGAIERALTAQLKLAERSMQVNGVTDLQILITSMNPTMAIGEYVFITLPNATYGDASSLSPIASFGEREGLSLIVPKDRADEEAVDYDETFRMITLQVHSSLSAVGFTSAVSEQLTKNRISANIVAAYFHDHIFVPSRQADEALAALRQVDSG